MAQLVELTEPIHLVGECCACCILTHIDMEVGETAVLIEFSQTFLGQCHRCGHWVSVSKKQVRDLTKAEANELENHPSFSAARAKVDAQLHARGFWG